MALKHSIFAFFLGLGAFSLAWPVVQPAHGSCGSVTCFVVIGSEQQVSPAGLLTTNFFLTYTPQSTLLSGTNGVIPAVDLLNRQLVLNHHQEQKTLSQMATLSLNYGVSDRIGIEVAIPYKYLQHHHIDGLGEDNNGAGAANKFTDSGFGDILVNAKYNWLPSLRSMIVTGIGVYLPTGSNRAADPSGAGVMEPTIQLGRGQVGIQPSFYQTYEIIPHRLNQFSSGAYRHTFRNGFGYQFGDQFDFSAGANLVTAPWLVLTNQFNFRYMFQDSFRSSLARSQTPSDPTFPGEAIVIDPNIVDRKVPTTGSTWFAVTPGVLLTLEPLIDTPLTRNMSAYFFAQVPLYRDFHGNLAQGTSYLFGITKVFDLNPLTRS